MAECGLWCAEKSWHIVGGSLMKASDRLSWMPQLDAAICIAGGVTHCEDKVWNGTGEWVHEAKTPLCDGDVGDEEGENWDVVTLGKS